MTLRILISILPIALAAACHTPGQPVRVRGVLDMDELTLSACDSGAVYDLGLADTQWHRMHLRVTEIEKQGDTPIVAKFEGELHDTPSMTRHPGRKTLQPSRTVAIEAGTCDQDQGRGRDRGRFSHAPIQPIRSK